MRRNFVCAVSGAGLGLRHEFVPDAAEGSLPGVDFLEVAPENWMRIGGALGKRFRSISERYPLVCHGLSLSIGGPAPLDLDFLRELKGFLDLHGARAYTEHLSYCSDQGQLYDLMPIPFTPAAARYVAERIRVVQEILERPVAIENVSYYAAPGREMDEIDFINAVLTEADCGLHLDVNNIYVNSINHGYDAGDFLRRLPGERIFYCHIAGHHYEAEDLRIDTHGAAVIDPVWGLLEQAYQEFGVFPTLLERDFNLPPLDQLLAEVDRISSLQQKWNSRNHECRVARG